MRGHFHPGAAADLGAAGDWYEQHLPGLGADLVDEVDRAMEAIAERPTTWSLWPGVDSPPGDVAVDPTRAFDLLGKLRKILEALGGGLEQFGGGAHTYLGNFCAPLIVFRLKNRTAEFAEELEGWISDFEGAFAWRLGYPLDGPGRNWVLGPQRLWDLPDAKTIGLQGVAWRLHEGEPEFAARTWADLERLTSHLETQAKGRPAAWVPQRGCFVRERCAVVLAHAQEFFGRKTVYSALAP